MKNSKDALSEKEDGENEMSYLMKRIKTIIMLERGIEI